VDFGIEAVLTQLIGGQCRSGVALLLGVDGGAVAFGFAVGIADKREAFDAILIRQFCLDLRELQVAESPGRVHAMREKHISYVYGIILALIAQQIVLPDVAVEHTETVTPRRAELPFVGHVEHVSGRKKRFGPSHTHHDAGAANLRPLPPTGDRDWHDRTELRTINLHSASL